MRRACQNHMPSISTVRDRVSSIISEQARLVERSRLDPRPILEPPSSPPTPPTRKSKLKKLAMPPEERRKLLAEKRLRPPVMKCTNGLPLLYFPGMKQSRKVTQAVNGQIKARTRKVDVVKYMEADGIQMAKLEDEWDRNLQRYAGFIGDRGSDSTWEASAHDALRILQAAYNEEKRKNITEINKLQGIIDSRNYQYGKLRQKRLGERRRRYRQRRRLAH
ncbi:hypothetical protein EDC01DRAFT_534933 [Geopyxis carbonaria]|nr:hypothetical protein EDC01DRAFT_534933 [Geopyxis carbonaria]